MAQGSVVGLVILLLLIVAPIVGGFVLGPNVLLCSTLCPFWFCSHLPWEERERELAALLLLSS